MWFDLKGRTTATMVIAVGEPPPSIFEFIVFNWDLLANPVGGAIGQMLSPLVGTARESVSLNFFYCSVADSVLGQLMVLAIISTAVAPALFLIDNEPKSPPSSSGVPHIVSHVLVAKFPEQHMQAPRPHNLFIPSYVRWSGKLATTTLLTWLLANGWTSLSTRYFLVYLLARECFSLIV
jgi:hypothetical protein